MSKFCRFCGKELVNGQCECPDFLAEQKQALQGESEAQQENPYPQEEIHSHKEQDEHGQSQSQPGGNNQQNYTYNNDNNYNNQMTEEERKRQEERAKQYAEYTQAAKENLNKSKNMFLGILAKPLNSLPRIANGHGTTPAIILGAFYALINAIIMAIAYSRLMSQLSYYGVGKTGGTFKAFFLGIILYIGNIFIYSAITFIISIINGSGIGFKRIFAMLSASTVPLILIRIITIVGFLISPNIGGFLIVSTGFAVIVLLKEIIQISSRISSDKAFWLTLVAQGVFTLIVFVIIKLFSESALVDMINSFLNFLY